MGLRVCDAGAWVNQTLTRALTRARARARTLALALALPLPLTMR